MKFSMTLLMILSALATAGALAAPSPAPSPSESGYPVIVDAPKVEAASPQISGMAAHMNEPMVAVADVAAPPEWAQQLMLAAKNLPVVGPIVTKALLWLGIFGAILTTLIGALLSVLTAVSGLANFAGLAKVAAAIQAFKDGHFMYWIKFFSMFNAKKPDPK